MQIKSGVVSSSVWKHEARRSSPAMTPAEIGDGFISSRRTDYVTFLRLFAGEVVSCGSRRGQITGRHGF